MCISSMKRYPRGTSLEFATYVVAYVDFSLSQLAESTPTHVLDEIIAANPNHLEVLRTRGIVHTFRDEYSLAVRDFTLALKEARAVRKARNMHRTEVSLGGSGRNGKKKKSEGKKKTNGQAPPSGTSAAAEGGDKPEPEPVILHPSVLPDAPEPIEPQLLFLRGAAYLQHAVFLIEETLLKLEGIRKMPSPDGAELRLCYLENGRYGGTEIGNPDGPLGSKDGVKLQAYRRALTECPLKDQILTLLKKSMRDHERFLGHFDTLESSVPPDETEDLASRAAYAFLLAESLRPGSSATPPPPPESPTAFTTYHPLLVEAHFSILICQLMMGDFPSLLQSFVKTASIIDGLEGYPVFLPPRSMSQAEFVEILERLAGGWKNGTAISSLGRPRLTNGSAANGSRAANGKLAIMPSPFSPAELSPSSSAPASPRPHLGPSTSFASSSAATATALSIPPSPQIPSGRDTPSSGSPIIDLVEALNCARILLAPVVAKQNERAEKSAAEKAAGGRRKSTSPISIPLHGPRVDIVLAWLAAVWLVELDEVA